MAELKLASEELTRALARAEEIAATAPGGSPLEERFAAYLQATDELGLPRPAVLQALKEQLGLQDLDVRPGTRLFAPAADGFLYAATAEAVEGSGVRVRYDTGGQALCEYTDLRAFSLAPGTLVQGCWGGNNSWYAARVRQYDPEKDLATVVYRADGVVELLPLERIRLKPAKREGTLSPLTWVPLPVLDLALKLTAGGVVGFLLARLLGN